jgi:hypothetical protein
MGGRSSNRGWVRRDDRDLLGKQRSRLGVVKTDKRYLLLDMQLGKRLISALRNFAVAGE